MDHVVKDKRAQDVSSSTTQRKPYAAPVLTDLGSIAEITRGTFAGIGADNTIYS